LENPIIRYIMWTLYQPRACCEQQKEDCLPCVCVLGQNIGGTESQTTEL